MRWNAGVALAVGGLMGACSSETPRDIPVLWDGPQAPSGRALVAPEWEQVWEITAVGTTPLALPRLLTARDSVVAWWDDIDHRVTTAGPDGSVRWSFGGPGEGPDEFGSVGAIAIDARGGVVALDSDNTRIMRLTPGGVRASLTRLPTGYWRGISLQPGGDVILSGFGSDEVFAAVDSTGALLDRFDPPWPEFSDLSTVQRQGSLISGHDGRWAYAFLIGNGWFPYVGTQPLDHIGQSVEHTDFPGVINITSSGERISRLQERPTCSACAGWVRADTLNLLFGGNSDDAQRLVDQYRWADGAYLRSLLLPDHASEAVQLGDLIILLTQNPVPTIAAYRVRSE